MDIITKSRTESERFIKLRKHRLIILNQLVLSNHLFSAKLKKKMNGKTEVIIVPLAVWSSLRFRVMGIDLYNKNRMTGDFHVRFCERLRVN